MKRTLLAFAAVAAVAVAGLGVWLLAAGKVYAHCDTLAGPVVLDAKAALEKAEVTPVLKWVKKEHEEEVRAAFKKTLAARAKGAEAKEVADLYFFETLVRLHRAGEGEPFTGLKPADAVEPAVAAADKAIAEGKVQDLAREIAQATEKSVAERFQRLMEAKKHKDESVEAGRAYVAAYVTFVHFVEGVHNLAAAAGHEHHGQPAGEKHEPKAHEHTH